MKGINSVNHVFHIIYDSYRRMSIWNTLMIICSDLIVITSNSLQVLNIISSMLNILAVHVSRTELEPSSDNGFYFYRKI